MTDQSPSARPPVAFRPVVESDLHFLKDLYRTTRDDIAALPLGSEDKGRLLSMQFHAQDEHYRRFFPDASFEIILLDDEPVGRLYVDRGGDEYRLIDIALLPEHRGHGLGTAIVRALLEEAARAGRPVRLRVEPYSPARRLYRRLGFRTIADEQSNWHMECRPAEVLG